ncbi:MAG: S26 family signal peptidase [Pseudomonadota bacterium]|nr:S26 family signal peptidase [Pseudomonadota bacterium]MDP1904920.1 S26 family signal peptidase [Pseudomonadota bacterium]MDP2352043.1 S26 family signal peptidase [Pseudomonadota bacterium]
MLETLYKHLSRRAAAYLWLLVAILAFARYFTITVNVSNSLPGTVFLVQKGAKPQKGGLAAFRYAGGGPYHQGVLFLKRIAGASGDIVAVRDHGDGYRDYLVNGQYVGRGKPKSKDGIPLEPGPTGVIPLGRYYMAAPNPDSLDSRYALVGWVGDDRIVGRAYKVF